MTNIEEIDRAIKAIQDMLKVWEYDELKQMLCDMLEQRSLLLLNQNKEADSNDILN